MFKNNIYFYLFASALHILYDQISRAEVDEALLSFRISKLKTWKHIGQLLLTILLVGYISILLDDSEALLELSKPILLNHVFFKFCKFTSGYVDHLLIRAAHLFHLFSVTTTSTIAFLFCVLVTVRVIDWRRRNISTISTHRRTLLRIWSVGDSTSATSFGGISIIIVLLKSVNVIHIHLVKECWILTILWLVIT